MTAILERPFCKHESCDVQVQHSAALCPAHEMMLGKWLDKSGDLLRRLKNNAARQEFQWAA